MASVPVGVREEARIPSPSSGLLATKDPECNHKNCPEANTPYT